MQHHQVTHALNCLFWCCRGPYNETSFWVVQRGREPGTLNMFSAGQVILAMIIVGSQLAFAYGIWHLNLVSSS